MKQLLLKTFLLVAIQFVCEPTLVQAQSMNMTGTVLTQPCNNNGQIGVTVTGLTPPISYTYTNWAANINIVHSGVTTVTDAATGLSAYQTLNFSNPNYWQISAFDGTTYASMSLSLTPAFTDSIKVTPGICPSPNTLQAINFVGGTSPYSVVWTNTATSSSYASNPALVPNGSYQFVITDAAGCIVNSAAGFTYNINVTSLSNINFPISGTAANCSNGTALVGTISGGVSPYTYLWSNSANTPLISGLTAGQYNCTVTDALGCQTTSYYNVTQAVTINYNSSVTNATCLQNNGSVLSFVSGGTAPYSYLWSNSSTTQNLTAVTGNQMYIVQITDANGCTGQGFVYVGATTPISVTYSTTASACTSPTGSATLTPTGGLTPYSTTWNTFPASTGISISNKPSGNYNFIVTDANGCVQSGAIYIPPVSIINANITNGNAICPATTAMLQVSASGSTPPFTYLWSNSATTSTINVPPGSYNCTITDAAGCSVIKSGYVYSGSPISIGFSNTQASCIFANDGSSTANAVGGTAPYTYVWSNSQTGSNATALTTGNYYVTATSANGCVGTAMTFVGYNAANNSCYCTLTGTVYADANSNCVQNVGEAGISNIAVHCSGFGYAYTNASGIYSFKVPTGTYTLSEVIQPFYPLASCQSNTQVLSVVAASNCTSLANFANTVVPIHDLHIITSNLNFPVPGNTYNQKIIVQNDGTLLENTAKLGYSHDGQLGYSSCNPWTMIQQNATSYPNWYSINSGFPVLNVGANTTNYISYNVPTTIPINTAVNFNDTIASAAPIATNWLADYTPWNNVNLNTAYVVASYDPNFKEVMPKGTGAAGNISAKDSLLTYVVHFQNTGSYFAQNIVVVDTLDSDLRISSLRPGYSDHNFSVSLSDNGVAKFTFKNINLPWKSTYGDVLSSGMFVYTVKMKKNLPLGTQIKNKAAIYFDYNDPIITNTTLNTLAASAPTSTTSVLDLNRSHSGSLLLFPNPASGDFVILYESAENTSGVLRVCDISGRVVLEKDIKLIEGDNSFSENTTRLQNGIYLVQLKTNDMTITKKLVVSK